MKIYFPRGLESQQQENNCGLTIGGSGRDKGKEGVTIRTLMQRGEDEYWYHCRVP